MFHNITHMREQLARWGPVKDQWMFGMEDYFGYLMGLIKNRNNAVQSIMRADKGRQTLTMALELLHVKRGINGKWTIYVYI